MSKGMKLNTWYKQVVVHERSIYQPVLAGFQIGANIKISGGFFKKDPNQALKTGKQDSIVGSNSFFSVREFKTVFCF